MRSCVCVCYRFWWHWDIPVRRHWTGTGEKHGNIKTGFDSFRYCTQISDTILHSWLHRDECIGVRWRVCLWKPVFVVSVWNKREAQHAGLYSGPKSIWTLKNVWMCEGIEEQNIKPRGITNKCCWSFSQKRLDFSELFFTTALNRLASRLFLIDCEVNSL